ncbi:MAG: transmembrane 220 family protein [Cytophagaceae bacterium]
MKKILKGLCVFWALLFIVFAALQLNDPDPEVWVPLYLFPAIVHIVSLFHQWRAFALYGLIFFYLVAAIYLWPDQFEGIFFSMDRSINIELARESLGLAICSLSFYYTLRVNKFLYVRRRTI